MFKIGDQFQDRVTKMARRFRVNESPVPTSFISEIGQAIFDLPKVIEPCKFLDFLI